MGFRKVDTSFWQDEFILELTPEEKYFYMYLMTNTKTSQCGAYVLPKKVIMFETGYNIDTINKYIQRFIEYGKIQYDNETKELYLPNWCKYNWSRSPKVIKRIVDELKAIKSIDFSNSIVNSLIEYGYSIDTLNKQYGYILEEDIEEEIDIEEDIEEEIEESIFEEASSLSAEADPPEEPIKANNTNIPDKVMKYFNEHCLKLKPIMQITKKRKQSINARVREYGQDAVFEMLNKASQSYFLAGQNSKNWTATFDWLFKPNNFIKVMEGNYDNRSSPNNKQNIKPTNSNKFHNFEPRTSKYTAEQLEAIGRKNFDNAVKKLGLEG